MTDLMPATGNGAAIHYQVELHDLQAHLYRVTLTVPAPQRDQVVSLPVWIAGSYLIREFSKNLQRLGARQGRRAVPLLQLDKHSWQVTCRPDQPLVLTYLVYAFDQSVRTAWLDARRGFFNGTSLCLQVRGQTSSRHTLTLSPSPQTANWHAVTGLEGVTLDTRGFGTYGAADYAELVDCPFEIGDFWRKTFTSRGIEHTFVVQGAAPGFDGVKLIDDVRRITEAAIGFWHGAPRTARDTRRLTPHQRYTFMLNAVDDGYGGLEHRNSTALLCNRKDLPRQQIEPALPGPPRQPCQSDGYTTLLGLISHEYFHTWNVKRLRPLEFGTLDLDRENYTELLWFFEGFTSYYDDLLLRRAGLLDNAGYLLLLGKTINQVAQTPGRKVQSVAQASLDAWVKYYRPDENTPNATVSYYTKGALIALCLDLTLRQQGLTTLDQVMRGLWQRCAGGPMSQQDLEAELLSKSGRCFTKELAAWVHGTGELPLPELLQYHGVEMRKEPAQLAQALGLRVEESAGVRIKTVLSGSAAERAGLAAGDEWLAVDVSDSDFHQGWRLSRLDDLPLYVGTARQVHLLVARDKRLMRLRLSLPKDEQSWRLVIQDAKPLDRWLQG